MILCLLCQISPDGESVVSMASAHPPLSHALESFSLLFLKHSYLLTVQISLKKLGLRKAKGDEIFRPIPRVCQVPLTDKKDWKIDLKENWMPLMFAV